MTRPSRGLCVLALAAATASPLLAATVAGTVTDSRAIPVASATVRWVDTVTAAAFSAVSNSAGQYFLAVPSATYDAEFIPPASPTTRLVAVRKTGIIVATTTFILNATLPDGNVLTGRVLLEDGTAFSGVDLDLLDSGSGVKAFVPNDLTDVAGAYRVVALPGFYDVRFRPPLGTTLVPVEQESVNLTADRVLGDLILSPGIVVSGEIRDSFGSRVVGADLDFVDHVTGRVRYTIRDNTDADGLFAVVVPPGIYDILFRPPSTSPRLASIRLADLILTVDTALPGLTMTDGFLVSGLVRNSLGAPLASARLTFVDELTGREVPVRGSLTDGAGAYSVAVLAGTYRVQVAPPRGLRLLGSESPGVVMSSDLTRPDVILQNGLFLSGKVSGATGLPARHTELDIFDAATRLRIYTPEDVADFLGNFSVVVAPGTYDVIYRPPKEADLLPVRRPAVAVQADLVLPSTQLLPGSRLTGKLVDPLGAPAPSVDLDVLDSATRAPVLTVRDDTDFRGIYSVVVPDGIYDLLFEPARGNRLLPVRQPAVKVAGPTDAGTLTLARGVLLSGRAIDDAGRPAPGVDIDVNDPVTRLPLQIANDTTDSFGTFDIAVPAGTYQVDFEPPPASRLVPLRLPQVPVPDDTRLADVTLRSGFLLSGSVLDPRGNPVPGVDLDVFEAATGAPQFTPGALTDAAGRYGIVLAAGTYNVNFRPPYGSRLLGARLSGIPVASDTDLGALTLQEGVLVSGMVLSSAGAPVEGVDLDFIDAVTARVIYTVRDTTDAAGRFMVAVPAGTYNVEFEPPAGLLLAARTLFAIGLVSDTALPTVTLAQGFLVTGSVVDPAGHPVAGAEPHFFEAATGRPVLTLRDTTNASGVFTAVLPAGRFAGTVNPPLGTSLGTGTVPEFGVSGATSLPAVVMPALGPVIFSLSPILGPTPGGTRLEILGQNFQPGTVFTLGGRTADLILLDGTTRAIIQTRSHPEGMVPLEVRSGSGPPGMVAGAFVYVSSANPIQLTVSVSGSDVVLSWPGTGQSAYTIFRSTRPDVFGDAQVTGTSATPGFVDVGATLPGTGLFFYHVE